MACTGHSASHRYLLPSLIPRLQTDNMAYESWVEAECQPEIAPEPLKGEVWLLGRKYVLPQGITNNKMYSVALDRVILFRFAQIIH